jgi:hypothetical protein
MLRLTARISAALALAALAMPAASHALSALYYTAIPTKIVVSNSYNPTPVNGVYAPYAEPYVVFQVGNKWFAVRQKTALDKIYYDILSEAVKTGRPVTVRYDQDEAATNYLCMGWNAAGQCLDVNESVSLLVREVSRGP